MTTVYTTQFKDIDKGQKYKDDISLGAVAILFDTKFSNVEVSVA